MSKRSLAPYPSPETAQAEMQALAAQFADHCSQELIGKSTQGRPLYAWRLHGASKGSRPRLLITAQIHAIEYIGSYVARAVARRLAGGYQTDPQITRLLDSADVWFVPLLNPDGAWRIWDSHGWSSLGKSRFTANGVDPNRNFPFVALNGRGGWNSASTRAGSAYYRGPHPLSEPECLALARLCRRELFCAAINFHSFGGVVFMPETGGPDAAKQRHVLDVFNGEFQREQRHLRYRPVPERSAKIVGQLDPFLLNAFGTPSVTVEVSRLGLHLLDPRKAAKIFWWANPGKPQRWVENDAGATVHALQLLLERSAGQACRPAHPELAEF